MIGATSKTPDGSNIRLPPRDLNELCANCNHTPEEHRDRSNKRGCTFCNCTYFVCKPKE